MTNPDLARNIAKGDRTRREADYPTTESEIKDALQYLTAAMLNKVAIYITDLRRAAWGLENTPESPVIDERPDPAPTTREPFKGTEQNPMPLGGQNETS